MNIIDISKDILQRTNGGLSIIQSLYPQATTRGHFKLRDERTASCSLRKMSDGNYIIKDFGSGDPGKNAIQLFAEENGLTFTEATLMLAKENGINVSNDQQKNEAKFEKLDQSKWDYAEEFDDNNFAYRTKEFSEKELSTLGPFITEDTCKKYNLYALEWYAFKKEGQITLIKSTDTYPIYIFVFINADTKTRFYKILQPKSEDKKWRFFWKGKKPADFMGGLDYLEDTVRKKRAAQLTEMGEDGEGSDESTKVDMVFLCSGERDAINMASLGYFVVWLNSETADLTSKQYKRLLNASEEIFNIPDLDETGRREGHALAMKYLDIKTLWLPEWLQTKRDWRGNARKDLCDLFELKRHTGKYSIDKLIRSLILQSYPMRFWDEKYNKDKSKGYTFNNVHAFNFLFRNGFCRLNVPEDKNGFKFIHINEHIVKEVKSIEVEDFIHDFLQRKKISTPIRNMVYNTTRLNSTQLSRLPRVDLDFTNYTRSSQLFFFPHESWMITKNRITSFSENKSGRYVFEHDIITKLIEKEYSQTIDPKSIKLEDDYFSIKKTDFHYSIEIKDTSCEYLNFLIQLSRVHWYSELEEGFTNDIDKEEYHKNNLFNIAGERLTDDQKAEQKGHLVNKIFTLGYLMHRYKNPNKAWAVYAMENNVIDDNESHGGSGKSLLLKTPKVLMKSKTKDARNPKIWEDTHILDGVDKHTDYILFDDADRNFKLKNIYSWITGETPVNPKNNQPFEIPFRDAPKFSISSNFSLRDTEPSTTRRLLFTTTSDYYHEASDTFPTKRDPVDDFGHSLFSDWNDMQWNKFFNLMAQCTKFYLSASEKINPPMNQVEMRNLQSFMGISFIEWADYYLSDKLNTEFSKREALEDMQQNKSALKNMSSTNFGKKIKAWCQFNGHVYMPDTVTDSNGRIQKQNADGKREDYLFIEAVERPIDENIENKETSDNIPF